MTVTVKVDASGPDRLRRLLGYAVAFVATFATLAVHLAMETMLGGRPTLVIFTIPIMLSAYIGGLGPGLFATLLSYLVASYYLLPPIHSFAVASPVEHWQQAFVALAGVVISVLNEALHRTRRRAARANAHQREAESATIRLGAIVESSDDAIISKDFNSTITSWNAGAERIFGYASSEMIGSSIMRLIPTERRNEEDAILAQIRRGERVQNFETIRQTKDGRLLDVSVTVSPIKDFSGKIVGASKIARDITGQKLQQREIVQLTRLYAALSQVNQAVVMARGRDELFGRVCRALVEQGGFKMAWIGVLDPATQRLHPASQWGDETGYLTGLEVYAEGRLEGTGPVITSIREGQTYVCNDFATDPRTKSRRESAASAGYRASAALPIRQDGAVCGFIAVYAGEIGHFKDREMALLEEAAGDLSFGLDNLARETKRRESEEALRGSEERLRMVTDNARVGLVMINRERQYTFANATYAEILGLASPNVIGQRVADVLAPLYEEQIRPRLDRAFAGERVLYELSRPTPEGVRFYAVKYEPTEVGGTVAMVVVVITEITERRRAEELMRASEARYHALFEYAPDGIVIADPESRYIDANASICRMLGYARDELIGLHASDIVLPEEVPHIGPALHAIKSSPDYHREWQFRRKDGSTFAAEVIATQMPDGNLLGMIRDITEQRTARQKIQDQLDELLRWQEVMLNREDRVEALKAEVNAELARQAQGPRYSEPTKT